MIHSLTLQRIGIVSTLNKVVLSSTRYWRLFVTTSNDVDFQNNYTTISDINFRTTPGVPLSMVGTATANSQFSAQYPPSDALDGNPTTAWITNVGNARNSWWQFTFTSPVQIVEVALTSFPNTFGGQQMIRDGVVQGSMDNGATWIDAIPIVNQRNWAAASETRVFTAS